MTTPMDTMPDTSQPTALRTSDWYRTATRWTQLTLAEDDPVRFDPEVWIDLFRRTRSNATCLSAGGYSSAAMGVSQPLGSGFTP